MKQLAIAIVGVVLFAACTEGNVFSLEVGDCFQDPGAGVEEIADVKTIDCGEPHDLEVYASFDLDDGDFPGASAVDELAGTGCLLRFADYVGRDYATSSLDFGVLFPTSDSWGSGDRTVKCALVDIDGRPLTGSMKDSGA